MIGTDAVDGRTARGRKTRVAIVDAAIELISTSGAGTVSHRTVAPRAGTSVASVAYHFGSIDDLLVAAFEELTDRTLAELQVEADRVLSGQSELVAAAVAFTLHLDQVGASTSLAELLHAAVGNERLAKTSQVWIEQVAGPFADLIGAESAATLVRSMDGIIVHHLAAGPGRTTSQLEADLTRLFDAFGLSRAVHAHAHPTRRSSDDRPDE